MRRANPATRLFYGFLEWCREGELNPQGTKYRRILSPLRLPVPPSRLGCEHFRLAQGRVTKKMPVFLRWTAENEKQTREFRKIASELQGGIKERKLCG